MSDAHLAFCHVNDRELVFTFLVPDRQLIVLTTNISALMQLRHFAFNNQHSYRTGSQNAWTKVEQSKQLSHWRNLLYLGTSKTWENIKEKIKLYFDELSLMKTSNLLLDIPECGVPFATIRGSKINGRASSAAKFLYENEEVKNWWESRRSYATDRTCALISAIRSSLALCESNLWVNFSHWS